ncbi:hypothetical protein VPH35_104815 [Triticum aestivum]
MVSILAQGGAFWMQCWGKRKLAHTMVLAWLLPIQTIGHLKILAMQPFREDGDAEGVFVSNSKGSCWTQRIRIGKAADEREINPSRVPALEASRRAYADKKADVVVNPALRISFDSAEDPEFKYSVQSQ